MNCSLIVFLVFCLQLLLSLPPKLSVQLLRRLQSASNTENSRLLLPALSQINLTEVMPQLLDNLLWSALKIDCDENIIKDLLNEWVDFSLKDVQDLSRHYEQINGLKQQFFRKKLDNFVHSDHGYSFAEVILRKVQKQVLKVYYEIKEWL